MKMIGRFLSSEDGVTSVEYAVMLALIIGTMVVVIRALGDQTSGIWADNQSQLEAVGF